MKKSWIVVLFLVVVIVLIGCKDTPDAGLRVTDITKDTIRIIFPTGYQSFEPPRFVTMTGGDYELDVYMDDGSDNLYRIGHYGLLTQTDDSVTLAMLGDGFDLDNGNYNVKLYSGNPIDNPRCWKKQITLHSPLGMRQQRHFLRFQVLPLKSG